MSKKVFTKSASYYQELPSGAVKIVKQEYDYERLIQEAERAAVASRPLRNLNRAPALPPNTRRATGDEDRLKEVRKEDAAWFRKVFPLAQIVQDSRDQTYAWRWTVGPLSIHWRYPKMISSPVTAHGLLEIAVHGQHRQRVQIVLDGMRFDKITRTIKLAERMLTSGSQDHAEDKANPDTYSDPRPDVTPKNPLE